MQAGILGLIELKIGSDFYLSDPHIPAPDFQIAFEAKEEILKYYVVGRKYAEVDLNQFSVVDDGSLPITFSPSRSSLFTMAEKALLTDASAPVIVFKSDTAVARTEKARKKIQLKKNGAVLIAHLPQPSPDKPNANMIIPVSKN
jgi:hypothetical protein